MGSRCSTRAIKENLEGERGSAIKRPELKMNQDLRKGREGRVLLLHSCTGAPLSLLLPRAAGLI